MVVGQPLLPILSIIFVVLLRGCVVLCLFVVLACCVQSRKPGVTIWELPDPTHLENKPIGRRCSLLPEERERERVLLGVYSHQLVLRIYSLTGKEIAFSERGRSILVSVPHHNTCWSAQDELLINRMSLPATRG